MVWANDEAGMTVGIEIINILNCIGKHTEKHVNIFFYSTYQTEQGWKSVSQGPGLEQVTPIVPAPGWWAAEEDWLAG